MDKLSDEVAVVNKAGDSEYRYGMPLRPLSLNTCPDGYARIEAPDSAYGRAARHGVLVYDRPLTSDEVKQFELPLLIPKESNKALAEYVLESGPHKYLDDYMDEFEEPIPAFVQSGFLKMLERSHDGLIALEDEMDHMQAFHHAYEERQKQANAPSAPTP